MDIDCICQCSEFKCDSEFEHLAKNPKNNIDRITKIYTYCFMFEKDDKDLIPREYRSKSGEVTLSALEGYLKKHEITPEEALGYVIEHSRIDPSHPRTEWKILRFTMYLWERHREYKSNAIGKKKDTCFKVVNSKKFKDLYTAYSFNPKKLNELKEAENLFKLVGDKRQKHFFKSRFYKEEHSSNKLIPQEIIDKIK